MQIEITNWVVAATSPLKFKEDWPPVGTTDWIEGIPRRRAWDKQQGDAQWYHRSRLAIPFIVSKLKVRHLLFQSFGLVEIYTGSSNPVTDHIFCSDQLGFKLHMYFLRSPTEKDILIEIATGKATTKRTLKRYWSDQSSKFAQKNPNVQHSIQYEYIYKNRFALVFASSNIRKDFEVRNN